MSLGQEISAPWSMVSREIVDTHGRRVASEVSDDQAGNLIAAAPDLLAALKRLFACCEDGIPGSVGSPLENARAAIARAEGRS